MATHQIRKDLPRKLLQENAAIAPSLIIVGAISDEFSRSSRTWGQRRPRRPATYSTVGYMGSVGVQTWVL